MKDIRLYDFESNISVGPDWIIDRYLNKEDEND